MANKNTDDAVIDFLYAGTWLDVDSSNVSSAQYDPVTETLTIHYNNGATWAYDPVSEGMAEDFTNAESKGTWMWDNIKVRGSKTAHQVNAREVT